MTPDVIAKLAGCGPEEKPEWWRELLLHRQHPSATPDRGRVYLGPDWTDAGDVQEYIVPVLLAAECLVEQYAPYTNVRGVLAGTLAFKTLASGDFCAACVEALAKVKGVTP